MTPPNIDNAQVTALGDKPLVLDPATGSLYVPGGKKVARPDTAGAKLQRSRPRLLLVNAPPRALGSRLYAGWAGSQQYVRERDIPVTTRARTSLHRRPR